MAKTVQQSTRTVSAEVGSWWLTGLPPMTPVEITSRPCGKSYECHYSRIPMVTLSYQRTTSCNILRQRS